MLLSVDVAVCGLSSVIAMPYNLSLSGSIHLHAERIAQRFLFSLSAAGGLTFTVTTQAYD
jgi:hypothetical protein